MSYPQQATALHAARTYQAVRLRASVSVDLYQVLLTLLLLQLLLLLLLLLSLLPLQPLLLSLLRLTEHRKNPFANRLSHHIPHSCSRRSLYKQLTLCNTIKAVTFDLFHPPLSLPIFLCLALQAWRNVKAFAQMKAPRKAQSADDFNGHLLPTIIRLSAMQCPITHTHTHASVSLSVFLPRSLNGFIYCLGPHKAILLLQL